VAKRLLLIDPMDGASFVEASRAVALGRIDYVEYKLGPPPNERFHVVVTVFSGSGRGPTDGRRTRWYASWARGGRRDRTR
jgi:hypothetical protein